MIHPVGIQYDEMTDAVELQILRDFMLLKGEWPDVWVNDPAGEMDEQMLAQIGVSKTTDPPSLVINYKVGPEFLHVNTNRTVVERDLCPKDVSPKLDGDAHVGYYMRPQGRDGANLTEMYLNRSHPRGNGSFNPMITLLWGPS